METSQEVNNSMELDGSLTLFPDLHSEVYEFKMAERFCLFLFRGAYRSSELIEIPKFNSRTGLNNVYIEWKMPKINNRTVPNKAV